jgi:SAM-dependent methyltransferase
MGSVPTFASLTDTHDKVASALAGSCVYSDSGSRLALLQAWQESRSFISEAIDRPGTILDYGCANGFLLRSLMEWSPHALTPFGVDVDDARLHQARQMFPGMEANFINGNAADVAGLCPGGFDFVYWAVGDNVDFERGEHQRWLAKVEKLVARTGRLIVGFYADEKLNWRRRRSLEERWNGIDGAMENMGGPESLVWTQATRWDSVTSAGA